MVQLYIEAKDYNKAEETVKKGLKKERDSTKLWQSYVCLKYEKQDFDGASLIMTQALKTYLYKIYN